MLIPLCPDGSSVGTHRHILHHKKAALLDCQKLVDEVDEMFGENVECAKMEPVQFCYRQLLTDSGILIKGECWGFAEACTYLSAILIN